MRAEARHLRDVDEDRTLLPRVHVFIGGNLLSWHSGLTVGSGRRHGTRGVCHAPLFFFSGQALVHIVNILACFFKLCCVRSTTGLK